MSQFTSQNQRKWWKEGVVYQIYPASFKDSNDDGVGDIQGIISKLDYIRDLGVDIIWISPHYKSPQVDMGYDISDFEDIHEPYGTLQDCERLIHEIHVRGMKVIFDLVINHTSNLHPWFLESRSSKTNSKRDWYHWRPARFDEQKNRCRPNNWRSQFTKPAWTWDELTQEYYLHVYAAEQPDLNWENENCRRAIYDSAIRFWLERGVDGFRIDTVNKYSKVPGLPDAEITETGAETQPAFSRYTNGPHIHEYLKEINAILSEYDVMTAGELPNTPEPAEVLKYIATSSGELNMVFNFDTVYLGQQRRNRFLHEPFDNADFKRELTKWQSLPKEHDAWTTVFLENHDQGRSISRFASDLPEHRVPAAKMLATVLCSLTGTLFVYQGQEIGMINAPLSWPAEAYKCVRSVNFYNDVRQKSKDDPESLKSAHQSLQRVARDHARVPMQWNSSVNSGFCSDTATPWMPTLESRQDINVASQLGREGSVLEHWRALLDIRREYMHLFVYGGFSSIEQHKDLLMFVKQDCDSHAASLTIANLSKETLEFELPAKFASKKARLLLSNGASQAEGQLEPFEARIYLLDGVHPQV